MNLKFQSYTKPVVKNTPHFVDFGGQMYKGKTNQMIRNERSGNKRMRNESKRD